ncbi:MAG: hypothetical protein GX240_05480 [Candidatus Atribacteria bacterium]|nr:hypothetical protein [Candidatus Atribacteria bacterium]
MKKILIEVDNIKVRAKLNDSTTAEKIWDLLPLEGKVNTWGDEIYFSIGAKIDLEQGASAVVSIGDLAYWPPGNAFCIFFGTTPASIGAEIRAASAVNIFGHIIGDYEAFKTVKPSTSIIITKITN